VYLYDNNSDNFLYDDFAEAADDDDVDDLYINDANDPSQLCPGNLKECINACSPIVRINQVAYKMCVNECLDRCSR